MNDIEAAARAVINEWERILGPDPTGSLLYRELRDLRSALAHATRGEGSLDATLADACEWFDKTIPHTADDDVTKFREESKEFLEQPSVEEAADAVLCLWHWAHLSGEDLHGAIRAKMAKNAARTWERQSNGTWHHVKRPTPPPATGEAGTREVEKARAAVIDAAKAFRAHDETYLIANYENVAEEGERQRLIVKMLVAVDALLAAERSENGGDRG